MIELPNKKKCYNLQEQVAQNLLNIQYLAEQYKNIDELPSIWADYKTAFDADLHTFEDWTTTFEGWENTLATYLANMSSAAVGALVGQDVKVKTIEQTNANYSQTVNFGDSTYFSAENIYNRFEVINNVLWAIVNVKITCIADVTAYLIFSRYIVLPSEISSKIYDMENVSCNNAVVGNPAFITGQSMIVINDIKQAVPQLDFNKKINFAISHSSANTLLLAITANGISFTAGDELWISARVPLTLI